MKVPPADRAALVNAFGPPRPDYAFGSGSPAAFLDWQAPARERLTGLLGATPEARSIEAAFDPAWAVATDRFHGIDFQRLHLPTFGGIEMLAWLALPAGASAENPAPAVIVHPGHNVLPRFLRVEGVDPCPPEGEGYQGDFDLKLLRAGYAVLTVDLLGLGHRRDPATVERSRPGDVTAGCKVAGEIALSFGSTLLGLRVHETRVAVGAVRSLPEVDADRVVIAGHSGGATVCLFAAALDDRIAGSMVSGYFNRFHDSILAMHHCSCNFVPNLPAAFDVADVAAMAAPTPLYLSNGERDVIFPIAAARAATPRVERAYALAGHPENLTVRHHPGGHVWEAGPDLKFLARHVGPPA